MKFFTVSSIFCLLASVIGIGASVMAAAPAETLLASATRVAPMNDVSEETYFWSSDHEVLSFRHVPQPFKMPPLTAAQRKSLPAGFSLPKDFAPGYYQTLRYDIRKGHGEPIGPFNIMAAKSICAKPMIMMDGDGTAPHTEYEVPPCALSPDGAWLVWLSKPSSSTTAASELRSRHGRPTWYAAKLDGSQSLTWKYGGSIDSYPAWKDVSHWVELDQYYQQSKRRYLFSQAVIHATEDAKYKDVTPINAVADGLLEGMTQDGALLVLHQNVQGAVKKCHLTAYSLKSTVAFSSQVITITLPHLSEIWEVSLSPDGNSLAWVLSDGENAVYQLWVSGLHGENMRLLGSMKSVTIKETHGVRVFWPRSVRWLPDGKALSFVFRHELWTLPL